ncbi:hypothetical protein L1887_43443 [Cichorium endivia]|nr:hypothetical protein L1887_43443 [Cichorium endivia]
MNLPFASSASSSLAWSRVQGLFASTLRTSFASCSPHPTRHGELDARSWGPDRELCDGGDDERCGDGKEPLRLAGKDPPLFCPPHGSTNTGRTSDLGPVKSVCQTMILVASAEEQGTAPTMQASAWPCADNAVERKGFGEFWLLRTRCNRPHAPLPRLMLGPLEACDIRNVFFEPDRIRCYSTSDSEDVSIVRERHGMQGRSLHLSGRKEGTAGEQKTRAENRGKQKDRCADSARSGRAPVEASCQPATDKPWLQEHVSSHDTLTRGAAHSQGAPESNFDAVCGGTLRSRSALKSVDEVLLEERRGACCGDAAVKDEFAESESSWRERLEMGLRACGVVGGALGIVMLMAAPGGSLLV